MADVSLGDKDREAIARVISRLCNNICTYSADVVVQQTRVDVEREIVLARQQGTQDGYARGWNDKCIRMGNVIVRVWPRISALADQIADEAHLQPDEECHVPTTLVWLVVKVECDATPVVKVCASEVAAKQWIDEEEIREKAAGRFFHRPDYDIVAWKVKE
jgi:hypothetical protein